MCDPCSLPAIHEDAIDLKIAVSSDWLYQGLPKWWTRLSSPHTIPLAQGESVKSQILQSQIDLQIQVLNNVIAEWRQARAECARSHQYLAQKVGSWTGFLAIQI